MLYCLKITESVPQTKTDSESNFSKVFASIAQKNIFVLKKQNYEFPVLRRSEQNRQMCICAELKNFPSVSSCFSLNIVSRTFGATGHSAHERINCFIC